MVSEPSSCHLVINREGQTYHLCFFHLCLIAKKDQQYPASKSAEQISSIQHQTKIKQSNRFVSALYLLSTTIQPSDLIVGPTSRLQNLQKSTPTWLTIIPRNIKHFSEIFIISNRSVLPASLVCQFIGTVSVLRLDIQIQPLESNHSWIKITEICYQYNLEG